ncbi:MAG: CoA transferase [Acetobacteraceae bacterium]|nr:CoA transferase [Acetobacteraceae bacterium]
MLLTGLRVVQIGSGLAAAVCGRLLADMGASVTSIGGTLDTLLQAHLNNGKRLLAESPDDALAAADILVVEGAPAELQAQGFDLLSLRHRNPRAALVTISPFGQTGPRADDPATDLTLMFASGIARLLTGQVDDLAETPMRPTGHQSAFIGGITAACAAMHAVQAAGPAVIDVSIQEALATLAIAEVTRASLHGRQWSRRRESDGNGATVCILPARDGFVAISPREERQWASWLEAMGSPDWGRDVRFATKADRVANWDSLHALMSAWSRERDKQWIADIAQAAHVPSFPLREPAEQLGSPQLTHREFFRPFEIGNGKIKAPGPPFGVTLRNGKGLTGSKPVGPLPLAGMRVLDFSWVIAGPTTTRYLAAMGADVIKVEAPGRGDPGRASDLHTVLGQGKRAIVLDLKKPAGVEIARRLAEQCDVLVENFATGVMDRLGLGVDALRQVNPDLLYVSASGLGRVGPESHAVAYGTLLQCYAGFAGLNRHPEIAPRVGFAWLDPMCGLMLAFIIAAGLWRRQQTGEVARVDFSMIEAMLWTMAEPLLTTQLSAPPPPRANLSECCIPHGAYPCAGDDEWISIAIRHDEDWRRLCAIVPGLTPVLSGERMESRVWIDDVLSQWSRQHTSHALEDRLVRAGIPAAALATSLDLVSSEHLRARGFWEGREDGLLPGLPWHASFGRKEGPAPELGGDTHSVLSELLGLSPDEIALLRMEQAIG